MRDLLGFYWDEERQRYFALQPEHVARGLQRCAFVTPAPVRASCRPPRYDIPLAVRALFPRGSLTSRSIAGPTSGRTRPRTRTSAVVAAEAAAAEDGTAAVAAATAPRRGVGESIGG